MSVEDKQLKTNKCQLGPHGLHVSVCLCAVCARQTGLVNVTCVQS